MNIDNAQKMKPSGAPTTQKQKKQQEILHEYCTQQMPTSLTSKHKNLLLKQMTLSFGVTGGNTKHRQREEGVLVGKWGALVGEMTYPSLSALVDGAGAGTVTVPTLSSLI